MPIFSKGSKELVVDLINESNPGLPFPLEVNKVRLGTPVAIAPVGILNTEIWVYPANDSPYNGKIKLRYRRIDLRDLFKNVQPEIHKYTSVAGGSVPFNTHQLLADFNARYGMNIAQADVTVQDFPAVTDGYYPLRTCVAELRIKPSCLAFVGTESAGQSLLLRWVFTERDLSTMITQTDLNGRLYPGGNNFDSNHPVVIALSTFGTDFSGISATLEDIRAVGGIQFGTGDPRSTVVLNEMNAQSAVNSWSQLDAPIDSNYGLRTVPIYSYTLPNALFPDVNPNFNRVAVIDYDAYASPKKQVGKAYLHYNA